ncbi:hypothetical protein EDB84DRAFT_1447350 [Lactarius hengduanensis]|nr:hypothetical protein EDB84DRAFT_1447350 [Lactarius hengduanensis]
MPCMRSTIRQCHHFLPHLPPGSMQCGFSLELVPPLFHAMRDGSSPPLSPLTLTASPSLILKPSGEVGCVSRGGYTLRDILKQQHRKGAQKARKDQQQKDKEPEAKGKARGVCQLTIEFWLHTSLMPLAKYDMTLDSAESQCTSAYVAKTLSNPVSLLF